MNYIEKDKKELKLDYINSDITIENFPKEKVRNKEFKVFHFPGEYLTNEEIILRMNKDGFQPCNLSELFVWANEWNGKDFIVAFGSVWQNRGGNRYVPCLGRDGSKRELGLIWHDYRWNDHCRFAAVRKSDTLKPESHDSPVPLTPGSLDGKILEIDGIKYELKEL